MSVLTIAKQLPLQFLPSVNFGSHCILVAKRWTDNEMIFTIVSLKDVKHLYTNPTEALEGKTLFATV